MAGAPNVKENNMKFEIFRLFFIRTFYPTIFFLWLRHVRFICWFRAAAVPWLNQVCQTALESFNKRLLTSWLWLKFQVTRKKLTEDFPQLCSCSVQNSANCSREPFPSFPVSAVLQVSQVSGDHHDHLPRAGVRCDRSQDPGRRPAGARHSLGSTIATIHWIYSMQRFLTG